MGTCTWTPLAVPKPLQNFTSTAPGFLPIVCLRPFGFGAMATASNRLGMEGHTKVSDVLTQAKVPQVSHGSMPWCWNV